MRMAVFTVGSHGDIHPFLAVARAAQHRGHEVTFHAHRYFAREAHACGLDHRPFDDDTDLEALMADPDLMHPRKGGPRVFQMLFDAAGVLVRHTREVIAREKPDVIFTHHVALGVRWVCEQAGVPHALGVLAPMLWFNPHENVLFLQRRPGALGRAIARAQVPLVKAIAPFTLYKAFNAIRRAHDLPPMRSPLIEEFTAGDLNLGLWSPHLRAPLPDDPPHGRICGFAWHDRSAHESLSPELESFLGAGEPPVVFSLGTAAVHAAGDYYHLAADAARRLGRRAVLLTGKREYAPRDLPPGVIAVPYAPFSLLMPRAACTVHHGGIGSTAQGLRSGRPTVICPHAHDQFNNAIRAYELGTSLPAPRHGLTAARLAAAVARVTADPSFAAAAERVAAPLRSEDGAGAAVGHLERLASGGG